MRLFVDTSSLVKYYYPETDSQVVEDLILQADRVYISQLSIVELASALMKKVRLGELNEKERLLIWEGFMKDIQAEGLELLPLGEDDYMKAAELILDLGERGNLRTLDSLQLAAALRVSDADFLAADSSLLSMANRIGLTCLEPGR